MNIVVTVFQILPQQTFTRKDGSQIVVNSFIGITSDGKYDRKIKFDVMKEETWNKMNLHIGVAVDVSFGIEAREYNGRWFNSIIAWKCVCVNSQQQTNAQQQQVQKQNYQQPTQQVQSAPTQTAYDNNSNDIPF